MARIFERLFPLCLWPGIDGIKRVENRIYACQQFAIQSGFEVKRSSTTGSNRPEAATNFLAINSRKSIMETTAHAQSYLRRHGCLAYLTQAFIPASFGDML